MRKSDSFFGRVSDCAHPKKREFYVTDRCEESNLPPKASLVMCTRKTISYCVEDAAGCTRVGY